MTAITTPEPKVGGAVGLRTPVPAPKPGTTPIVETARAIVDTTPRLVSPAPVLAPRKLTRPKGRSARAKHSPTPTFDAPARSSRAQTRYATQTRCGAGHRTYDLHMSCARAQRHPGAHTRTGAGHRTADAQSFSARARSGS